MALACPYFKNGRKQVLFACPSEREPDARQHTERQHTVGNSRGRLGDRRQNPNNDTMVHVARYGVADNVDPDLYPTPVGEGLVASLPEVIDPLELPRTGAAWVGREWNGFASQGTAYLRCPQSPGQGLRFGRPHSIPTIYEWHEFANAGGLMTFGVSLTDAQAAARCGAGIERR